jgi:starch synthase (maltosyl-transferring)
VLSVHLRHRPAGRASIWVDIPMTSLGNDEWAANFVVRQLGAHEYTVEAWVDHFLSWRRELDIKARAGVDVALELIEGAAFVEEAAGRCGPAVEDRDHLLALAAVLRGPASAGDRTNAALDERLVELMQRHADRRLASTYEPPLTVTVERERARFGAWYEMFPRSWGPSPDRSATFGEAALHLAGVAALGFDVVYLPPIHPIGSSFRKGRGNALVAAPGDPGSPWAIGSSAGGHKAIEPSLGTLEDFRGFVATARDLGLEVALDLAYQCSPDHPYVWEHPEWFRHRPDGSIKYAENPPKKYQDIYPFDFETDAWQALWLELLSIVLFWVEHGVRIFRVDNPHTKPFAFWEWLIAETRRGHPDVIFLAEAFTRPKVMGYLAKGGFSQSYSYFTWRNTRAEIEDYFTELTTTDVREYMRPNLFTNTPDILHRYLQEGGPPAFRVRLLLAATLGATYGIYSGFELCENRAVPDSEEYLESEKYQIRHWDWDRPGHIKDLIGLVNRIRREHRSLQFDRGLEFHACDNQAIVVYTKTSPDGDDRVLVVVNLDPDQMQHGWISVPATALAVEPGQPFAVRDLLTEREFAWTDERHYVRLDPATGPGHVLVVVPS